MHENFGLIFADNLSTTGPINIKRRLRQRAQRESPAGDGNVRSKNPTERPVGTFPPPGTDVHPRSVRPEPQPDESVPH